MSTSHKLNDNTTHEPSSAINTTRYASGFQSLTSNRRQQIRHTYSYNLVTRQVIHPYNWTLSY
jgi:hypothetical protein